MLKTLKEMGIPTHLIMLLKSLYENQEAVVRTEYGDTGKVKIGKGVRQGCILSPVLSNLDAGRIIRMAELETVEEGVKITGQILKI